MTGVPPQLDIPPRDHNYQRSCSQLSYQGSRILPAARRMESSAKEPTTYFSILHVWRPPALLGMCWSYLLQWPVNRVVKGIWKRKGCDVTESAIQILSGRSYEITENVRQILRFESSTSRVCICGPTSATSCTTTSSTCSKVTWSEYKILCWFVCWLCNCARAFKMRLIWSMQKWYLLALGRFWGGLAGEIK